MAARTLAFWYIACFHLHDRMESLVDDILS
jgi:hypothetical protein